MGASLMVVREVADQDAAQVPFTEDEHVIQTLPPDRTDEALREGILPWAVRGPETLLTRVEELALPPALATVIAPLLELLVPSTARSRCWTRSSGGSSRRSVFPSPEVGLHQRLRPACQGQVSCPENTDVRCP